MEESGFAHLVSSEKIDRLEKILSDELRVHAEDWILKPGDEWHGFEGIEGTDIMLDPVKVTVLTPGIEESEAPGIPAKIVSKFLREQGIAIEKTGLYSFLILFTIGTTKGKSVTLLSALSRFKAHYDRNTPVSQVFPDLIRNPDTVRRYGDLGIKDLCTKMHGHLANGGLLKKMLGLNKDLPKAVTAPSAAYEKLVRNEIETVDRKDAEGRISATAILPYPPAIPIVMPGEEITGKLTEYIGDLEEFDEEFPGFETEVHGVLLEEAEGNASKYKLFCVKDDGSECS